MKDDHLTLPERIAAAISRITNGNGNMRIPAEATDPDLVLAECAAALEYYSAIAERREPKFVPHVIRAKIAMQSDMPGWTGGEIAEGIHKCECNQWGAVTAITDQGHRIGIRPNEFTPMKWRPVKDNAGTTPVLQSSGAQS